MGHLWDKSCLAGLAAVPFSGLPGATSPVLSRGCDVVPGSATRSKWPGCRSGPGGRRFKSCLPDHPKLPRSRRILVADFGSGLAFAASRTTGAPSPTSAGGTRDKPVRSSQDLIDCRQCGRTSPSAPALPRDGTAMNFLCGGHSAAVLTGRRSDPLILLPVDVPSPSYFPKRLLQAHRLAVTAQFGLHRPCARASIS
jgi:hypothetical protein